MKNSIPKITFKRVLLTITALGAIFLAHPAWHLCYTALRELSFSNPIPIQNRVADDYSHLNAVPLTDSVVADPNLERTTQRLRDVLVRAKREHLGVSIAGARHSQGGQSLVRNGIQVDLSELNHVEYDATKKCVRVGAGARWDKVIRELDKFGRSVAVMQSDMNFSVGGSLSVNCHGWQSGKPPIASTVRGLLILTADGRLRQCTKKENSGLLRLALGGYGLFGIILEAELETVPDIVLKRQSETLNISDYTSHLDQWTNDGDDRLLLFGRLCIAPSKFLKEATLNAYVPIPVAPWPMKMEKFSFFHRLVFRGEVDSDYGKELRWILEKAANRFPHGPATRNDIQYLDAHMYANHDPLHTDILQEYFVPPSVFAQFVASLAHAVRSHECQLLNVTVRDVMEDRETAMPYARGPRLALVLFFDQRKTSDGERHMRDCTRELIDAALRLGGTYYLPYRPHATRQQFLAAYPMAPSFVAAKHRWDPEEVFQNEFYRNYLKGL